MKKVAANSDIHWVLFDEENRAVGFYSKSGGLWFFLDKLKRSCARDSRSGSISRVIRVYARGIRFTCLQMIYEIFINYMTEILSLRLEITVCTLVRFRC
uniref:Uncharacterized protein n=1 Tax=Cucumis melo TaxID=3656 RepID=A0A9I9EKN2_CUCME